MTECETCLFDDGNTHLDHKKDCPECQKFMWFYFGAESALFDFDYYRCDFCNHTEKINIPKDKGVTLHC